MQPPSLRTFIITTVILLLLTIMSIFWFDKPLASYINQNFNSPDTWITPVILFIETIFGFSISKYLFGFILIILGAVFYFRKRKSVSRIFFFIGATHIISRLIAGVIKDFFLRPRPSEWLEGNEAGFFSSGSSFPSGHTVHFFGLFLPIVFIYPKFSWIILLPLFVGFSRIIVNHHYLSDITSSITIAFIISWVFAKLFKIASTQKVIESAT